MRWVATADADGLVLLWALTRAAFFPHRRLQLSALPLSSLCFAPLDAYVGLSLSLSRWLETSWTTV